MPVSLSNLLFLAPSGQDLAQVESIVKVLTLLSEEGQVNNKEFLC